MVVAAILLYVTGSPSAREEELMITEVHRKVQGRGPWVAKEVGR